MAELKWTVFYKVEDAGNQAPIPTAFSKLKVKKTSDGSVLEKNKGWNSEPGKIPTNEPQRANFVTVIAESAEEACKVVEAWVEGNVTFDPAKPTEPIITGPKLSGNVNGKYFAALSSNLEEVAVMP